MPMRSGTADDTAGAGRRLVVSPVGTGNGSEGAPEGFEIKTGFGASYL